MAEPRNEQDEQDDTTPPDVKAEVTSSADEATGVTVVSDDADGSPADEEVAELLSHTIDVPVLAGAIERQEAADAADALEHLEDEEAAEVLIAMDAQAAAEALAEMETPLAEGVLEDLLREEDAAYAGLLLGLMAPDDAADLLQYVDADLREALYREMSPDLAAGLQLLVGYDETSAGGLMTTDYLALRETETVDEATESIRGCELPDAVVDLPVIDENDRLVGVVGLRSLLLSGESVRVGDLMDRSVKAVRVDQDQEDVAREFDRYDLNMLPVVDQSGRLLGIVTVDDIIDTIRAEQTEDVQKTVGAGAEEAVYSGILDKFRGRFPWLVVSVLIMTPSAYVVLQFEGLISDLAMLAVLMPVVAAVAGNAGHQALAVTLRGIVLDEVRPDRVWPLIRREAMTGALTGAAVGLLVGSTIAVLSLFVDFVNWKLGVVAAGSLTVCMAVGTLAGSLLPLLMRRCGADPAQSSAIFLIMVTDAVAFMSFLGLAYLSYQWLIA